jgi:hypothetical protein
MKIATDFEPSFDWYQATFKNPPGYLIDALKEHRDFGSIEGTRPQNGYSMAEAIRTCDGETLATIHYGGNLSNGVPTSHLISTGSTADSVAHLMRQALPNHQVTRLDVCLDYMFPKLFDLMVEPLLKIAETSGVRPYRAGDWDSDTPARTLYLGSPSSRSRMRIYEKGVQLMETGQYQPNQVLCFSESSKSSGDYEKQRTAIADQLNVRDWVRFELQLRPSGSQQRFLFAHASAEECWGASPASRSLIESIGGPTLKPMKLQHKKMSELDRKMHFMAKHYGAACREFVSKHGKNEFIEQLCFKMDIE